MTDVHDRKQPAAEAVRQPAASEPEPEGEQEAPANSQPSEPQVCMPCHGSGQVISKLGDQVRKVTCPWCGGSGERLLGMDAQQWQQEQTELSASD